MAMGDEVNIDTIPVACDYNENNVRNIDLDFLSTNGVLRLEMDSSFFNLSYSIVTSETGTRTALFHTIVLCLCCLSGVIKNNNNNNFLKKNSAVKPGMNCRIAYN